MKLNSAQEAAVEYLDGPLLVIAGAGSGKTRVIAAKVEHLLKRHLSAEKIAAITFTNKSAREMRERLQASLPSDQVKALNVCTFHALGLKILQIEHARLRMRRGFAIADSQDSHALLKGVLPEHASKETVEHWRRNLSRYKNAALAPADLHDQPEAQAIYAGYEERLARFNSVDFDDLILKPLQLFRANEEAMVAWRERLRYLLIDEYQDTNLTQYALVKSLTGSRGAFTAVGDDDQSIYAFRGARAENLLALKEDWPSLKVIALEQNYRSSTRILRAANAVIAHNPHVYEKRLWSALGEGEQLQLIRARDPEHEAEVVVTEILRRQFAKKQSLKSFAVLFRGNYQARPIELALRAQRVPYHLSGGMGFFERQEVKDVLAYLRLLVDPDDDQAFLRVVNRPARDVGAKTLDALAEVAHSRRLSLHGAIEEAAFAKRLNARSLKGLSTFAAQLAIRRERLNTGEVVGLLSGLLDDLGYRAWLKTDPLGQVREENLNSALEWLKREERPRDAAALKDWVNQLAILGSEEDDSERDQVRLMTLHASKGLEFEHVFLIGVEEGMLPSQMALDENQEDEERRLFYVGITRARQSLTLTQTLSRRRFGNVEKRKPSRFIDELPKADLKVIGGNDDAGSRERNQEVGDSQLARIRALLGG